VHFKTSGRDPSRHTFAFCCLRLSLGVRNPMYHPAVSLITAQSEVTIHCIDLLVRIKRIERRFKYELLILRVYAVYHTRFILSRYSTFDYGCEVSWRLTLNQYEQMKFLNIFVYTAVPVYFQISCDRFDSVLFSVFSSHFSLPLDDVCSV
jgi:hypothetical protein